MKKEGWKSQPRRHGLASLGIKTQAPKGKIRRFGRNTSANLKHSTIKAYRSPLSFLFSRAYEIVDFASGSSDVINALDNQYHIVTDVKGMSKSKVVIDNAKVNLNKSRTATSHLASLFSKTSKTYNANKIAKNMNSLLIGIIDTRKYLKKSLNTIPLYKRELRTSIALLINDLKMIQDRVDDYINDIPAETNGDVVFVNPKNLDSIRKQIKSFSNYLMLLDDVYLD